MKNYFAYKNGMKYRFTVSGCTSWLSGNFYHAVKVERKPIGARFYEYLTVENIHCCYNGLEAVAYIANKHGLKLDY